jgi:hypothetical protein
VKIARASEARRRVYTISPALVKKRSYFELQSVQRITTHIGYVRAERSRKQLV